VERENAPSLQKGDEASAKEKNTIHQFLIKRKERRRGVWSLVALFAKKKKKRTFLSPSARKGTSKGKAGDPLRKKKRGEGERILELHP